MNNLDYFDKFITKKDVKPETSKDVFVYTRVSSRDQANNYSLENQLKSIRNFAKENNYNIIQEYGHTYESAKKNLTRKEFTALLKRIESLKKPPFAIIVNIIDRFSRDAGNAIGLVDDLIQVKKVHLIEASTGLSTENEADRLEVYNKLIKANKENLDRIARTRPGLISHLEQGYYLGRVPRGYDHFGPKVKDYTKIEGKQRIVLNDEGKLLKKAWKWKLNHYKDFEIRIKLESLGLKVNKQFIFDMWDKPFYCGINTNSMLSKPTKGNWEPIVSIEDFKRVQAIDSGRKGYQIEKKSNPRPLVHHLFCANCNNPLTGYEVKKKKLHYYTCQKCNGVSLNAQTSYKNIGAHDMYINLLDKYELPNELIEPFKAQLKLTYRNLTGEDNSQEEALKTQLMQLENKQYTLAEKLLNGTLNDVMYKNMNSKLEVEIRTINSKLNNTKNKISNLNLFIENTVAISQNISNTWASSGYDVRVKVQNLLFPDGILYDGQKRRYLTKKVNTVFSQIRDVARVAEGQKKDSPSKNDEESGVVAIELQISNQYIEDANAIMAFYSYLQEECLLSEYE